MEKEERLDRVSRRKVTWLTNKLCKDIIVDIVNGMETAIAASMMKELLEVEWARRFWQMESEKMTGRLQGMTLTEKREAMEVMEMGDELRDIDGDIEMEMDERAKKRTSFARKSCLKFKGRLRKVAMEVETLGTIQEEVANWHTVRGEQTGHYPDSPCTIQE